MNGDVFGALAGRRSFLRSVFPAGALFCLGGGRLLFGDQAQNKSAPPSPKHKFLNDSGMSFAEVFGIAYGGEVPIWRGMEKEMGREKFATTLKRIMDELARRESAENAKRLGKDDLATYTEIMRKPNRFWQNVVTFQTVEDTPRAFEAKVTECLWSKTFRDMNAGDLGYLLICYGDYAAAEGFNPKMRMVRTKTLMQGDAFCNHRYVIEG